MLHQNYPNPFNPATTIRYDLPREERVTLRIYGIDGRLVRNLIDGSQKAGRHEVVWEGTDGSGHQVATGIYLFQLQAGEVTDKRKMVLLR